MIKIKKRRTAQTSTAILVGIISVVTSILLSCLILEMLGYQPLKIFTKIFAKTYFRWDGILENLVTLVPISLCALSVLVPAKAGFWNIGIDGQFYMGAIAATGVALAFPGLPAAVMIPLMLIAAIVLAGLVGYICIIPRVKWGINEILVTILFNSIIIYFVRYLVYDAWADPKTVAAQTPEIAKAARLPILISDSRLHVGFIFAVLIVLGINYILNNSIFGYELRLSGDNPKGADYAGIDSKKYAYLSMVLGAALAGIAGMLEVSGIVYRLQPTISSNYGFSAFVIAWVARLSPIAVLFVGYLFSGLLVAGFKMQIMGLPSSIVGMLKGSVLLFVLAGEILVYYKIKWVKNEKKNIDNINRENICKEVNKNKLTLKSYNKSIKGKYIDGC